MLITEVWTYKSSVPFANKFVLIGNKLIIDADAPKFMDAAILERRWLRRRKPKVGDIIKMGTHKVSIPIYTYNRMEECYDVKYNESIENAFAGFVSKKDLPRIKSLFDQHTK